MELDRYLAEKIEAVNGALAALLPGEKEFPQSLHKAMRYSVFAGGKRLRPVLVLAACEAVGADTAAAMNTACALECIHTYSLIHDDLPAMDDDDMRRGIPTCHKVYGEACAILAGDALLTSAFSMIAATPGLDGGRIASVITEVSRAAGPAGMIGGQVVDMESEGKEVTFPVLEYIHIHKTGELILASVKSGAIIGGAGPDEMDALVKYGEAAGLAFQIADDILDVVGSSEHLGKTAGADLVKGKATYPAILGLEASKERAAELVDIAVDALKDFDEKADPLREIAKYIVSRNS